MKTIKIVRTFTDLREAIESTDMAYGLEYYASYVVKSKIQLLDKVKKFYVTESGDLVYVTRFRNTKTGNEYGILHKFEWNSCLSDGNAAIVYMPGTVGSPADHQIIVDEYKFNRDYLRTIPCVWTTESF